jgi:hypothetical protein
MQHDAQCTYRKYHEMQDVFAMYFVELSSRNALTERESLCPHRQGQPPAAKKAAKAASLRGRKFRSGFIGTALVSDPLFRGASSLSVKR